MKDFNLFPYRQFMADGWQPIYKDDRCHAISDNTPQKNGWYFVLFLEEFSNIGKGYSTYGFGIADFNESLSCNLSLDFVWNHGLHVGGVLGDILMYKPIPEEYSELVNDIISLNNVKENFNKLKNMLTFYDMLETPDNFLDYKQYRTESEPFSATFKDVQYLCNYGKCLGNCVIWLEGLSERHAFMCADSSLIDNNFDLDFEKGEKKDWMYYNLPMKSKGVKHECIRITSKTTVHGVPKYDYVLVNIHSDFSGYYYYSINDFNKYFKIVEDD